MSPLNTDIDSSISLIDSSANKPFVWVKSIILTTAAAVFLLSWCENIPFCEHKNNIINDNLWTTEIYLSEWWEEKYTFFLWNKKIENPNKIITVKWELNYKIVLNTVEINEMSLRLKIPYQTILNAVINDERAWIVMDEYLSKISNKKDLKSVTKENKKNEKIVEYYSKINTLSYILDIVQHNLSLYESWEWEQYLKIAKDNLILMSEKIIVLIPIEKSEEHRNVNTVSDRYLMASTNIQKNMKKVRFVNEKTNLDYFKRIAGLITYLQNNNPDIKDINLLLNKFNKFMGYVNNNFHQDLKKYQNSNIANNIKLKKNHYAGL